VNKPLEAYLQPWLKQGVFLEIAAETAQFTVTVDGCAVGAVPWEDTLPLADARLHCHYRMETEPGKATFTLTRTREDLAALARDGYALGILGAVGLYRELVGRR